MVMNRLRNFVKNVAVTHFSIKLFLVYAVSVIVFKGINLSFPLYLLLLVMGWGISLAAYPCRKNRFYQRTVLAFVVANVLGFITAQYENLAMFVENISFSIPARGLLMVLAAEFICVMVQLQRHGDAVTDDEQPELFEEHRYDLQRVKGLLASTPIFGIDSSWGNGKSFVVDYLVKDPDIQAAYFVIKIEALAYQFEEFDSILIHKLDALLQENGVFSIYSEEIQEAADKSLLGRILYYFFRRGDSSRTSTFESLRTSLATLSKKVLIIYEDLERVGKPDLIKRLFAISERLVGKNVQVIYEYDGRQLDEQGLERAYREKYIPLEMNLTPIRYESMVEYVWDELRMETIDRTVDIDSTKTIKGAVCHMGMVPFSGLFPKLQAMATVNIDKNALTVRRMRIFLTELKSYLASHEKLSSNEISIVIAFYFIKHFMYEQFQCLKVGKTLEETFLFSIQGQEYTLEMLADLLIDEESRKKVENTLVHQDDVARTYTVYCLFRVDAFDYYRLAEAKIKKEEITENEMLDFQKREEKREKTNRLIWNLLANGESEYTDAEACVRKFEKDVLNVPRRQQRKAWNAYSNDLYNSRGIKNNTTIFKIGNEPMLDMAKALYVIDPKLDTWKKFISFLQDYWQENHLGLNCNFIKICQYFPNYNIDLFMNVIKVFIAIPIAGNFNDFDGYYSFLAKYINGIFKIGILRSSETRLTERDIRELRKDGDITGFLVEIIQRIIKRLRNERKKFDSDTFHDDIDTIISFLERNITVMRNPEKAPDNQPKVNIRFSGERVNQKVIDEILQILFANMLDEEKHERFKVAIKTAYAERKLTYDDVRYLYNEAGLKMDNQKFADYY